MLMNASAVKQFPYSCADIAQYSDIFYHLFVQIFLFLKFFFAFLFLFFGLTFFDGQLCDHRKWKCSTEDITVPCTVMRNAQNESVATVKLVGIFLDSSEGRILETQWLCRTLTVWMLKVSHLNAAPQTAEILVRKPRVARRRRATGKMLIGYKFEMEFLNTCPQEWHLWLQLLTWCSTVSQYMAIQIVYYLN